MAGVLERLKNRVEREIEERISRLEPKLDRMITLLEEMNETLKRIEKKVRK